MLKEVEYRGIDISKKDSCDGDKTHFAFSLENLLQYKIMYMLIVFCIGFINSLDSLGTLPIAAQIERSRLEAYIAFLDDTQI